MQVLHFQIFKPVECQQNVNCEYSSALSKEYYVKCEYNLNRKASSIKHKASSIKYQGTTFVYYLTIPPSYDYVLFPYFVKILLLPIKVARIGYFKSTSSLHIVVIFIFICKMCKKFNRQILLSSNWLLFSNQIDIVEKFINQRFHNSYDTIGSLP